MRIFNEAPIFKILAVLALLVYLMAASCSTVTPVYSQEGTPYPTLYCGYDSQGNWICFSGTNDLTVTPTVALTGAGPDDPQGTPAVVPTLATFVPTATPVPTLTPTPTVEIKPADVCVVFYCSYLPFASR